MSDNLIVTEFTFKNGLNRLMEEMEDDVEIDVEDLSSRIDDIDLKLLEDIGNNNHKDITLYTMEHCPACKELKTKLDHVGIVYENVEMEGNDEMWEWLKENGGKDYVPQVKVEDKLISEFDEINDLVGMVISEMIGRKIVIK